MAVETRPPLPPFTQETASIKVRGAVLPTSACKAPPLQPLAGHLFRILE